MEKILKIFYLTNKKIIPGGYIPGEIPGAKGEDIPDSFQYKVPSWVLGLEKAPNPKKEAERVLVEKYQDPLISEAFEEDESLYNEFTSLVSKIRDEWSEKVFQLIPVITGREIEGVWLPEDVSAPSGFFLKKDGIENDAEAQNIWEEEEKRKNETKNKLRAIFEEARSLFPEIKLVMENSDALDLSYKGESITVFPHTNIKDIQCQVSYIEKKLKEQEEIRKKREIAELEYKALVQERIRKGEIAFADNQHLFLEGHVLRAPSWAVPHLIGRGGRQIHRVQEILGKKIRIESYPAAQPSSKAKAGWLI